MAAPPEFPIHEAIARGFFQQIRFLVMSGHDVNARDKFGQTPLILCSMIGDEEWACGTAGLFIENGARISRCDKRGYNALHHACMREKTSLVKVLLKALDCDIHSRSSDGSTSLHVAALLGNMQIIREIAATVIRYKMTPDPKNRKGRTPLQEAWKFNHVDCGDFLVSAGADNKMPDPEVKHKVAADLRQEAVHRLEMVRKLTEEKAPTRQIKAYQRAYVFSLQNAKVFGEAKPSDPRNSLDYLRKVYPSDMLEKSERPSLLQRPSVSSSAGMKAWKDELLHLWQQYEFQFTVSFRRPALQQALSHRDSVFSRTSSIPHMSRRNSRMFSKTSRSGSVASNDGIFPRKLSTGPSNRRGMPPLVRTQSRSSFSSMPAA